MFEFIITSALSTYITEKFRFLFKRPHKSNVDKIQGFYLHEMPEVQNIGQLRVILEDFADDVPFESEHDSEYLVFQTRIVNGAGVCHIGKGQRFDFPRNSCRR